MRIDRKTFRRIYRKSPEILEIEEWFFTEPQTDAEVKERMSSKLWRLCNMYTVLSKQGELVTFDMNYGQHVVYAAFLQHPRLIILKSRQQGISTLWLVFYFDECIWDTNKDFGLMAQGLDEAAKLLDRINVLWDNLDPWVKEFTGVEVTKDNIKEWSLSNNCTIFIRTSFRSTTLHGLHVSEYGKIANNDPKKVKELNTGTLQALAQGRPGVIESTAEGENDFKAKWDRSVDMLERGIELSLKDFYPVFLSWYDDPDCVSDVARYPTTEQQAYFNEIKRDFGVELTQKQINFWIAQHDELIDEGDSNGIHQEYPASPEEAFGKSRDGKFYAEQYRNRVVKRGRVKENLYDPNLDTEAVFDLGMNDTMAITFIQEYDGEVRIIDEYANSGYDIEHYCDYMKSLPYRITRVVLPHDAKVTELTSGKSRLDVFRANGIKNITVLKKLPFADGIDATRLMLKNMWIDPKCGYLIKCLTKYSKEWDERTKTWKPYKHIHNEWSNGADSLRYTAMSRRKQTKVDYRKLDRTLNAGGLAY